jgi:hypothetical protein
VSDLSALKVGDSVWIVPDQQRGRAVTVEKVGRLYLKTSGGWRVQRADGYGEYGVRAWASEADWRADTEADAAWLEFYRGIIPWRRPPALTAEQIRAVAAQLGIVVT